jgi:hypothetical protein
VPWRLEQFSEVRVLAALSDVLSFCLLDGCDICRCTDPYEKVGSKFRFEVVLERCQGAKLTDMTPADRTKPQLAPPRQRKLMVLSVFAPEHSCSTAGAVIPKVMTCMHLIVSALSRAVFAVFSVIGYKFPVANW